MGRKRNGIIPRYMQDAANQLEVKRLLVLGEGGGKKRELTRAEKTLLSAGGQVRRFTGVRIY